MQAQVDTMLRLIGPPSDKMLRAFDPPSWTSREDDGIPGATTITTE